MLPLRIRYPSCSRHLPRRAYPSRPPAQAYVAGSGHEQCDERPATPQVGLPAPAFSLWRGGGRRRWHGGFGGGGGGLGFVAGGGGGGSPAGGGLAGGVQGGDGRWPGCGGRAL